MTYANRTKYDLPCFTLGLKFIGLEIQCDLGLQLCNKFQAILDKFIIEESKKE